MSVVTVLFIDIPGHSKGSFAKAGGQAQTANRGDRVRYDRLVFSDHDKHVS